MSRRLRWASAGAASAVAVLLDIAEHGRDSGEVAYTDPGSEHPDNGRFLGDLEDWFMAPILRLRSAKYADTWDVWERTRYLVGPDGARCTGELKRAVRAAYERPDDVHVFGFTIEEADRADRFREQNPGVELVTPLIDARLTKSDCLAMVDRAGLQLPAMYLLGYRNNNCVGCPKAGIGYWNKGIRVHFPETFARMAALERDLGHTVLREEIPGAPNRAKRPLYLDELDPDRGDFADQPDADCSIFCVMAEMTVDGSACDV